jgi:hypothetical protein
MKVALLMLAVCAVCIGCGADVSGGCFITTINVSPQTATVNQNAAPPGNSQVFLAFQTGAPSGCAFTLANLQNAVWTVSDPVNATISNSHDQMNADYGRATCINAAPAPITVTATVPSGNGNEVTASATLTCN